MTKPKACKKCNMIYEGNHCPNCESKESTEGFKGRVVILNPEKSEIAKKLKISKPGSFAIKTK